MDTSPVIGRLGAPLGFIPGSKEESDWHDTIARVVASSVGKVCAVCGLEQMGHGPESSWLGFDAHPFAPRDAMPDDLQRADELTHEAYAARQRMRDAGVEL